MRRAWIGLALLSASWLFGLSYYLNADWSAWIVMITVGTALLIGVGIPRLSRLELGIVAALTVPAIWLMPWPHRAGVLLLFAGALLCVLPIPRRWPARLGAAGITAGAILVVQSLGMLLYESVTARSHELPRFLAPLVYSVTRLIGIDAALDGTTIAIHTMRRPHYLGATWELLLDPATWCFLLGGVVLLILNAATLREEKPRTAWSRPLTALVASVALWLPMRAGLLIAVFVHRALRTEYEAPLVLMNQFWNPWVHLVLLTGPVLLAMRFVRGSLAEHGEAVKPSVAGSFRHLAPAALTLVSVALITTAILWDPPGPRKQGRILVDEFHSTWEPTNRPFDTNWYGQESGYNYACIYDYCSRFYTMGRLTTRIDANALDNCDVLIVKVPTARYGGDESARIEQFVRRGGGLLLIGEHTNVFQTGVHLNDIASRFGFQFRYDCLFDIDGVFRQLYQPPLAPHPIVQHMPPLDFAVSCSIAPGVSAGWAVIRSMGLRNLPADYHASNFYPQVEDRAEARYGAFVQLWTTRRGAGRVAAFTDSTVFSNFSTFEPGKAELMLGMLDWLNYRNRSWSVRPLLLVVGVMLMGLSIVGTRKWLGSPLVLLAAATFGWSLGIVSVRAAHQAEYPSPQPVRPFTEVVIDRTACDALLSTSGFIGGEPNGFGIFERWILRLGCFTSRRQGDSALTGDLLVFMHPHLPVSLEFRASLGDYVAGGGKVLILDSPANAQSTANALLYPFKLSVEHATPIKGTLTVPASWPVIAVDSACQIKGGTPLIRIGDAPVAATVNYGQGSVTVVGFASRFTDRQMGVTGDVVPDTQLRAVYDLQFALLRSILPAIR
jgi:hypothetical protein